MSDRRGHIHGPPSDLDTIRERFLDRYDPDEIVDVLDISGADLLERFDDKFLQWLDTTDEGKDIAGDGR